jgi:hypothetical protein
MQMMAFVLLYECLLGIHPHWGLWKKLFFLKRHRSGGEVFQTGGVSIQACGDLDYFNLKQLESIQGWRKKWFYLREEKLPSWEFGAPEFTPDAIVVKRKSWRHQCTAEEENEVAPLMARMRELQLKPGKEVAGTHLIALFLQCRVQPLKARVRGNPSRAKNEEMSMKELENRVRALTRLTSKDDLEESEPTCLVTPFRPERTLGQICRRIHPFECVTVL